MQFKKPLLIFFMMLVLTACEDILEEVDISNQNITILAPLQGVVLPSNSVNFNWDTVEDATDYQIQLALPDFVNTQQIILDSIVSVDSLGSIPRSISKTLLNGNYTWRIKATNSGFETLYNTASFEVSGDANIDVIAPNTPELTAPTDGFLQDNTTMNFGWLREAIAGTAERDSIYFYTDELLENQVGKDLGANKEYSASFTSGTYYWLVMAFDVAGNESEFSETFSFTIN
jgi:hypothetical protein